MRTETEIQREIEGTTRPLREGIASVGIAEYAAWSESRWGATETAREQARAEAQRLQAKGEQMQRQFADMVSKIRATEPV